MSTLTLMGILLAILLLSWVTWSLIKRFRSTARYEEELNQRLRNM